MLTRSSDFGSSSSMSGGLPAPVQVDLKKSHYKINSFGAVCIPDFNMEEQDSLEKTKEPIVEVVELQLSPETTSKKEPRKDMTKRSSVKERNIVVSTKKSIMIRKLTNLSMRDIATFRFPLLPSLTLT
jgi:hypothetical protein